MKTAQELRVGNVVMINNTPMVILKSEYSKGGRGASTVKLTAVPKLFIVLMTVSKTLSSTRRKFLTLTSAILCMFGWTTNTTSTKLKLK